jgi:hypothetical protein
MSIGLLKLMPRLGLHLVLLVILKMIVLTFLWHTLIKPYRVSVKSDDMAQRIASQVVKPTQEN